MTDETVRPPRTSRHIPLPPPSQATLDARRVAEERAARAGGVHADIGQIWARKSDGILWRIAGAKGGPKGHVFALVDETDDVIEVDPDDLVDDYTPAGCDHEAACCTTHRTHTSPHMGCILR
jgi:hypothetical protein